MRKRLVIPIVAALMITGCISPEQAQEAREIHQEQKTYLEQRVDFLEQERISAAMRGDLEGVERAEKKIAIAEGLQGGVDKSLEMLNKVVDEQGQMKAPEEIIKGFDPVLPAGVGTGLLLIAGLVRAVARKNTWKRNFDSLVDAIEDTKNDSEGFSDAMHNAGESLRSRLPSATKAEINKRRR